MLCRLASPAHTEAAASAEALAIALPILVSKGLGSTLPFVKAHTITTLSNVIDVVSPAQISAHIADLVQALLESLSNLEHSVFATMDQQAERLGVDRGKLEERRVALSNQTPMHSSLERCTRLVTAESVPAVAAALCNLIRRGALVWCSNLRVLREARWPWCSHYF